MRIHVVGTGLIGASVGLSWQAAGHEVTLWDPSPITSALAQDLGAGHVAEEGIDDAQVVVIAAPPDVTAQSAQAALRRNSQAIVMDVASVKSHIIDDLQERCPDHMSRFVPGHPMAGRERSGPIVADADLFQGRTWVLCPHADLALGSDVMRTAGALVQDTGAVVVHMAANEHDQAVAALSHLPQVAASLVAGRFSDLSATTLQLTGQGARDVTRIAASDPMLWTQILAGNARWLLPFMEDFVSEAQNVVAALRAIEQFGEGAVESGEPLRLEVLANLIAAGQDGVARLPGKHGSPATRYSRVEVLVPDRPGALGELFVLAGSAGINLEDVRLEHSRTAKMARAELMVMPAAGDALVHTLESAGFIVRERT